MIALGARRALAAAAALVVLYLAAAWAAFSAGLVVPVAAPLLALVGVVLTTSAAAIAGEVALRLHLTRYSQQLEADVEARTATSSPHSWRSCCGSRAPRSSATTTPASTSIA